MQIPSPQVVTRGWRCLSEADLATYADGVLTGRRKTRSDRHLAACEYCRHQLAFLLRSERVAAHPLPPGWMQRARTAADASRPAPAVGWAWTAVTAALVLGAALGAWRLTLPQPQQVAVNAPAAPTVAPPVPTRAAEAPQVRHFGRIETPIAISVERDRTGLGVEFRWKPVASAISYELRVLNAAGDTVWQARTRGDQLRLPASVSLENGQKYFVMISAALPNGKVVRSKATPFEAVAGQEQR